MTVWAALLWGAFTSASLYIGEALAGPMRSRERTTGLVMAFGAGTMLSAVAYELVPASSLSHGLGVGIGLTLGSLAYFVGDRIVDRAGGDDRQQIADTDHQASDAGSGAAMFVGALLDGVPEAFILGTTISLGGAVSVAFVAAVFISNIPQGVAGTTSLLAAGYTQRSVFRMWTTLMLACAVVAAVGFLVADSLTAGGLYSEAFAGGAVLTMLADSMMPEAFRHGGKLAGLLTVFGFLVAGVLSVVP
jgi:zinc transporter, ZIP family